MKNPDVVFKTTTITLNEHQQFRTKTEKSVK